MNSLIPQSPVDITKELVEGLLRTRRREVTVESIEIVRVINGTGTNICLQVNHTGASDLPARMWLKTGFQTVHLERVLTLGLYAREARFYADLQPIVQARVPDCYAAISDEATGRGVVLLQDMIEAGATFPGGMRALSIDQVTSGLDLLADLHSCSWERDWLSRYNIGKFITPGSAQEKYLRFWDVDAIAKAIEGPVGDALPAEVRDPVRVYEALWRLQPLYQRGPCCLLHGDAHLGNCFITAKNEIGLLDWQIYVVGPWAHDFTYCLVGGLSVDDRRQHERSLLQHYLGRMSQNSMVEINAEEAWINYRRFIAYGLWVWLRVPPAQQPIENTIALSERFGAAMTDHRVFELLGI
jgi:aminoglycoside phosphotransferase (APT) family kinase protein